MNKYLIILVSWPKSSRNILRYQKLQLLTKMFNEVHQKGLLPATQLTNIGTSSMSLFLCVGYHDVLPLPLVLFMLLCAIDSTVIVQFWIFGLVGNVHQRSLDLLDSWKSQRRIWNNSVMKRRVRGLAPLKIMFGSCNFIEKSTSLVTIDFSVDKAVSLLIGVREV